MDEQHNDLDLDFDLDDPFNPKKDPSVWRKRIIWGLVGIALVVCYIYLQANH